MPVTQQFVDTLFTDWFITNHDSISWSGGGATDAFFQTLGNGTLTTFTLTHNLATADVFITVYDFVTLQTVYPATVVRNTANTATITFTDPPLTNSVRAVVWKHNTFAANIGDGTTAALVVTHSIGSRDVFTQFYDNTTKEMLYPDVVMTTTNTVTATFLDAPATNSVRAVVGNTSGSFAGSIGDGVALSIAVTHNLGTRDVYVVAYDNTTFDKLFPDIEHTNANTATLTFTDPPTASNVRVLVGTSAAAGGGNLTVGVQYYTRAPSFFMRNTGGHIANNISAVQSLSELDGKPGWQKTQYVNTQYFKMLKTATGSDYNVALVDIDGVTPLNAGINQGWTITDPTGDFEEEVVAAVFYINGTVSGVVNPIIFVTKSLFAPGTIVRNGSLLGQATSGGVTGWLYSFTNTVLRQGPLSFIQTDVPWEPSNTVHVWPQPQRVNLIGNPSFEDNVGAAPFGWIAGTLNGVIVPMLTTPNGLGIVSWDVATKQSVASSAPSFIVCTLTTERHHTITLGSQVVVTNVGAPFDGTFSVFALTPTSISYVVAGTTIVPLTVTGPAATIVSLQNPRKNAGLVTASVNEILVQSNFFSRLDKSVCVSAYVAAANTQTMQARVGLICWDDLFINPTFVFGAWTPIAQYPNYHRVIDVLDFPDDDVEGQLVIHIKDIAPVVAYVDNAAVEFSDSLRDYFDGDTNLGALGDFSWLDMRNRSVSCWYNNFSNTEARLFTHYDNTVNQAKPGLTGEWVPTGSQVIPHWYFFKGSPPGLWQGNYKYHIGAVSTVTTLAGAGGVTVANNYGLGSYGGGTY